ncbi:hypothetical protein SAMN05660226_02336 [Parapedobacter luteus]|uniref:Uncharacterized protein n=2 Tax=Parapedobacter luteus TaxID=623280 RepID=A0A1T5CU29_9SPHI|nr:hypothetical protein SAMN05660226_02336 [Parapedobacter luteus]
MVAVMMFSVCFAVAKHKAEKNKPANALQMQWEFNPQGEDQSTTNPENYQPGSLGSCEGDDEVCGIIAPEGEPGHPLIVENSDLYNRILTLDGSAGDVFLRAN